jgi:hypothetical protein
MSLASARMCSSGWPLGPGSRVESPAAPPERLAQGRPTRSREGDEKLLVAVACLRLTESHFLCPLAALFNLEGQARRGAEDGRAVRWSCCCAFAPYLTWSDGQSSTLPVLCSDASVTDRPSLEAAERPASATGTNG